MVNGQPSGYRHSRCHCFGFQTPSAEVPIPRRGATCIPLYLRGPTLPRQPRDFADRESTIQAPLGAETSERRSPISRLLRIGCHVSLLQSTAPVRSGNRYSRFQGVRNSYLAKRRTPRTPVLPVLRLTSPLLPSDPTIHGNSQISTGISSRRFSSS
jgi:hypothetical protein